MAVWTKVATLGDVVAAGRCVITLGDEKVVLFYVGGEVFAIEERCPHVGAPLSDGEIHEYQIECPLHGARFDMRTGKNLTPPAKTPARVFDVKIEAGDIFLQR